MPDTFKIGSDGVEQIALRTYTEKAYLDYSMYVILDRALPNPRVTPCVKTRG